MALLTASAQLRSGGMDGSANIDELRMFGADCQNWKSEVMDAAIIMADQNKADYESFLVSYRSGKFTPRKSKSKVTTKSK